MGCGGGCGDKKFSERQLAIVGEAPDRIEQFAKSVAETVMVILVGCDQCEVRGTVTGRFYGKLRRGAIFPMKIVDYKRDTRVTKATQESLRMFA